MRTVTFSDRRVAEKVNSQFVPVWFNRGRGFHNCERKTEKWIFESHGEAYPTKNICTFFLTPDLRVVSYVAGYVAPELFLEVLGAARELQGTEGEAFAARHRRIAEGLGGKPERPTMALKYRELDHRHTRSCVDSLSDLSKHRQEVHESLAASGPVPFEKVQHRYLYGNPFSEEVRRQDQETSEFPRPKVPTPGGR
jgi:uncharacterized protein YyaL (SSP411 family)